MKVFFFSTLFLSTFLLAEFHTYHGKVVEDRYQWLENMDSEEVKAWTNFQNNKFDQYLQATETIDEIKEKLMDHYAFPTYSFPTKREKSHFYLLRDKEDNKPKLYQEDSKGVKEILFDPAENETISGFKVSMDGTKLAYGISIAGSDGQTWYFLDLEEKKCLPFSLKDIKFSEPTFDQEGKGVYYSRFAEEDSKSICKGIFYHNITQSQETDTVVYEIEEPKNFVAAPQKVFEGKHILFYLIEGSSKNNGIILLDVKTHQYKKIIPEDVANYSFCGAMDNNLLFITDQGAPFKKIISIDIDTLKQTVVIPECEELIQGVCLLNQHIVIAYLKDCSSSIRIFDLQGNYVKEVSLPGKGNVSIPSAKKPEDDKEQFIFSYSDFTQPNTIYSFDILEDTISLVFDTEGPENKSASKNYETKQIFFPSKDGTMIPMFISYKRGLVLNEKTLTLMNGYGGFSYPLLPMYSPMILTWLDQGNIYASVNLRGGSEYGEKWHQQGILDQKQNVFDDFIYAAKWLIENGYTTPKRLGIAGKSNGGLLVGACLVQRPDLFGACVPQVGVLDMLKFHKFTIGWAWKSDYGDPEIAEDFEYLFAYSPYHNIKMGSLYPPTLVTTSEQDDRVVPLHSFKFSAQLQEAQSGNSPIFLRTYKNSGHGAGSSKMEKVEEWAEMISFLLNELGEK